MATGHRGAPGLSAEAKRQQALRSKELEAAGPASRKGTGQDFTIIKHGRFKESWEGSGPKCVKEEPGDGLQQCWEIEWQQFLKTTESPSSEESNPALPTPSGDTGAALCVSKGAPDASQQARGEAVPHFLTGLTEEALQIEDLTVAKDETDCRRVKQEGPDEESYEEVILGEGAINLDAERRYFRQFNYQDAQGPGEVCGELWKRCCQWLHPERHTKEQILDLVVLEQFLAILPQDVQSWVEENDPVTCSQAVILAEDLLRREKQEVPGPFQEEEAGCPKAEGASSDCCQWPFFKELKQEEDGSATLLAGDTRICQEEDSQAGNSGEVEPHWMLTGGVEQSISGAPEKQQETCPEKGEDNVTYAQEVSVGVNEETVHEGILASRAEKACVQCGGFFRSLAEFIKHQRIHGGEKPYEHSGCAKTFCSEKLPIAHLQIEAGEKPYICSACGKSFGDHTVLVAHERTHGAETLHRSVESGPIVSCSSLLVKGKRMHTEERPYKCTDCEKCFGTRAILISHKRTHTGEKPYKCSECGKCFSMASALIRHKRTHMGERPYKCLECGRCFGDRSGFNTHARTHTGEKLYHCLDCGKSFGRQAHLVDHERTHTGEKPYKCSACEKCFSSLSILIKHKRTHTGERPYKCSFCAKSFSQSSSCMKHERTHTGEKPYKCFYCGQCFSQNSSCVRHERTHTGEKPFK